MKEKIVALLPELVALLALLAIVSSDLALRHELLFSALIASVVVSYAILAPVFRLASLFGFFLPISTVLATPYLAWDLAQFVTGFVLLLRNRSPAVSPNHPTHWALGLGVLVLLFSIYFEETNYLTLGFSFIIGATLSFAIRGGALRPALLGFVISSALSATAVTLEVFSGIAVGSGNEGEYGFTGFGGTSTFSGPIFGLALYLLFFKKFPSLPVWLKIGIATTLGVGILLAGSRSGLVVGAIAIAAIAWENRSISVLRMFAPVLIFAGSIALFFGSPTVAKFSTRAFESTERWRGVLAAVDYISVSPIFGIHSQIAGVTDAVGAEQIHSTFLFFPAFFGLMGTFVICGLFLALSRHRLPAGLFVMVVFMGIVEIQGFLGGGSVLPLILALSQSRPRPFLQEAPLRSNFD